MDASSADPSVVAFRGPRGSIGFRLTLRLFPRRLSQPARYHVGIGNEVQLSAEIIPVGVRQMLPAPTP